MAKATLHKCDLILEREDLAATRAKLEVARTILRSINNCTLEHGLQKCERAMEDLAGRVRQRQSQLGDQLNPIFDKWSNDELA